MELTNTQFAALSNDEMMDTEGGCLLIVGAIIVGVGFIHICKYCL
ncbi:MAG: class IIb bacteriocin, lactobin A/cerein 7B family [Oscillospiraceae bacterium]|nr:class IIb bacteriocin, lactobin A/cerein 7B family [Oscillospiraceae bacterium]